MKYLFVIYFLLFSQLTFANNAVGTGIELKDVILEHVKNEGCRSHGTPLLTYAIQKQYRQIAIQLIRANEDPDGLCADLHTSALIEAVILEDCDLVEMLLQKGADPNIQTQQGTPLSRAIGVNKGLEIAKILLKSNANPNFYNWILSNAINEKNIEKYNLLLDYGANPNNNHHNLTFACDSTQEMRSNSLYIIQSLIGLNVEINPRDSFPLEAAAISNWLEVVLLLLKNGADINHTSSLSWSAREGQKQTLVTYHQKTSIIGAVVSGANVSTENEVFELIDLFLELHADINEPTVCKFFFPAPVNSSFTFATSPLLQAIVNKNYILAEYLIKHGASTEILIRGAYSTGYTPLIFTISFNDIEGTRFLLAHGADPTNRGNCKEFPLEYALSHYKPEFADEIAAAIANRYTSNISRN